MRHRKSGRQLNRNSSHRQAMFRNMATSLIEHEGLKHEMYPGYEGAFVELQAPEGTTICVFDKDFLGESYVVDESDEVPPELQ